MLADDRESWQPMGTEPVGAPRKVMCELVSLNPEMLPATSRELLERRS